MEVRYAPNDESYQRLTTRELRSAFLVDSLFAPGIVTMLYSDVYRVIVGSAVPTSVPLKNKGQESSFWNGARSGLSIAEGKGRFVQTGPNTGWNSGTSSI